MGRDLGGLSSSVSNMELVSVVIPCFNSGDTLQQTLDSVKRQTWPNTEIIVVDDGSSESETINLIDSLREVTVIRQPNRGLPAARNVGFRAAGGEYVLPLDSDDWLAPEALMMMLSALKSSPKPDFVFCDTRLEGEAKGVLRKQYNYFEQLFLNQLPYCLLMRKRIWEDVGGYDESMTNGYEDWEFNIRLGLNGYHGLALPRPLFHYRVTSSGMLISKSNRMHGLLWSEIQARHQTLYKVVNLYRLWRQWRRKSSRYSLSLYFFWFLLHRCLPAPLFSMLFRRLRARKRQR